MPSPSHVWFVVILRDGSGISFHKYDTYAIAYGVYDWSVNMMKHLPGITVEMRGPYA